MCMDYFFQTSGKTNEKSYHIIMIKTALILLLNVGGAGGFFFRVAVWTDNWTIDWTLNYFFHYT